MQPKARRKISVRKRALRRSVWQDNIDRAQKQLEAAIAEKTRYINGVLKMPAAAEIQAKTQKFAKDLHSVKKVFRANPKKGVVWNALHLEKGWLTHPIKTANALLRAEVGMGIGRKSKAKQVAGYKANLEKITSAFEKSGLQKEGKAILERYSQKLNAAMAEFKQTGNQMRFERLLKEAELDFNKEFWGVKGPMLKYVAGTGRKMAV